MRVGYVEGLAVSHDMIMKDLADMQPDMRVSELKLEDLNGDSTLAKWYQRTYDKAREFALQSGATGMGVRNVLWRGPKPSSHTPTPRKLRKLGNGEARGSSAAEAKQLFETTGRNGPTNSSSKSACARHTKPVSYLQT